MRPQSAFAALLALLCAASSVRAQASLLDVLGASGAGRNLPTPTSGPLLPAPMSGPIDPAEYIVGPGDLLQINLSGGVTRSWEVMVSPEGTLFLPSVGSIPVTGQSLLDARRAVLQRVSSEYRGVNIDLRLLRPRTMLVFIAGASSKLGPLEVSAANRVSEVLNESFFAPNASRRNVQLRRRTPQGDVRIPIDLTGFLLTGHMARNPLLRDGDMLFLPVALEQIAIDGAVGRPSSYELAPGDSLSTLFALAGGPLANAADQATLVQFRDATHTDSVGFWVSEVMTGHFDLPLRGGDRVFVYYRPGFHDLEGAGILGEVVRPGTYPLDPGRTKLSDLVRASGGFLPTADLAALRVFRANPPAVGSDPEIVRLTLLSRKEMTASEYEVLRARLTARREDYRLDWKSLQKNPDLDLTLRAGDVVRVDKTVASVRVEGEVRRPGLVRFEKGRSVSEYVRLTGGFSNRASRGQVRITRAVTGQTILARDISTLEPGDLVWVPERGETANWENLKSILLVLAQIATVIVAVRR